MTKVRVIIVTYNSEGDIVECVESIMANRSIDLEIIVVDNASADRTIDSIKDRFPQVKIIENHENLGYVGNNLALTEPLPDLIAFVNPDTKSNGKWLGIIVEQLKGDAKIGAYQPKILLYHDPTNLNSRGNEANFLFFGWPDGYGEADSLNDEPRKIPFASGCAAVYRGDCIAKLKGFDDSFFMYGEDVDLGVRLFLLGYDTMYVPDAIIYHKYKFKQSGERYYLLERNRLRILLKTYRVRTLVALLPIIIASESGIILRSVREGWLRRKLFAYGAVTRHLPDLMKKRQEVQGYRTRTDAELIRALKGAMTFSPLEGSAVVKKGNELLDKYREFLMRLRI